MDRMQGRLGLLRALRGSGRRMRLTASGSSMQPLIPAGALVEISFEPAQAVRAGDVILFARGETLVLHRVLRCLERDGRRAFVEKGDRRPGATEVAEADYLGRLVRVEAEGRVFRPDSTRGRLYTRLALAGSRTEERLRRIKRRVAGDRFPAAGRIWGRLSAGIRSLWRKVLKDG